MIDDPDNDFPFASGRYQVSAGLQPLRGAVFHIGKSFDRCRANKMAARSERLSKYFQLRDFDPSVRAKVQKFIFDQLLIEHAIPLEAPHVAAGLRCRTGDRLRFAADGSFIRDERYSDGFDALAMQVEEDIAVMRRIDGQDSTCAIHLCAPNHWSAEQRIGQSFVQLHEPVAEIEAINRNARNFVDLMIRAERGLTRTAWGIATDDQLNRHPEPPPGSPPGSPPPRRFDPKNPRAFVRIEDQTMVGFPEVEAAMFVIRTRFIDCATLDRDRRGQLSSALRSMSVATLEYKGLLPFCGPLIAWLSDKQPT